MRVSLIFHFGIFVAILTFATFVSSSEDPDDICRLFPNNTEIGHPQFCTQKIKCIDFVSHITECDKKKPYYNATSKGCVETLDDYSRCHEINCKDSVSKFIDDPSSCRGYYYCVDKDTPVHGDCPNDLHFEPDSGMCMYKEQSECKIEYDFCSFVPNGIKFADETSITSYLSCTKGKLGSSNCVQSDYDRINGTCTTYICGYSKKPIKNKFIKDPKSCRSYYYCAEKSTGYDEHPTKYTCPKNLFYSEKDAACLEPLEVYCTADRCEGQNVQFVTSSTTYGCRNYYYCQNGKQSGPEGSCNNNFFHEDVGACMPIPVQHPACTVK